jgi:ubiquitin C-terminal hydrolase
VEGEVMDGENAWFNEKTQQKENVRKKISFWSFPTILVIDLKRFNYRSQKNQILVDFPINNLDLSEYVIGYKKYSYVYDLYGVCNHSGSSLGGHYTAYVKNADDKWYLYNDTNVSEVKHPETIISPKAYCLFYRKRR